ncbi:MAG: oligopeptide/dipeptide ABC transporter ATP-binding protein [Lachnospiraceae bacterium]
MEDNKKVLLSVKDLHVKFHVRGRVLTAIRGISLDIYEDESIAIVGESGSGKSVFTKTFAGMLDSNGFIDQGSIVFNDSELADTVIELTDSARNEIKKIQNNLDEYSKAEAGSKTYCELEKLEAEKKARASFSDEEIEEYENTLKELNDQKIDLYNLKQTFDSKKEKSKIKETQEKISDIEEQIKKLKKSHEEELKLRAKRSKNDADYMKEYEEKKGVLEARYKEETAAPISEETRKRNEILAKEIFLSAGRYRTGRKKVISGLQSQLAKAMKIGVDLNDEEQRNAVFGPVTFRVRYEDETSQQLHGTAVLDLANVKNPADWSRIRGRRVATVFQDPMTSLNPVLTIGKQMTSVIMKHQGCSYAEARKRAIEMMSKVGIPKPEKRFDDYPHQYSGGMRQRIVIAIALSCRPKILICDEPTTALDVTIQAQILQLIKDLQKEFHYTIVFITHDLGVVANIADRVAVLYAGQIVEVGTVREVFYDPHHPYTWALLSSLPQLAQRNTKLYSITGTPPSLYNKIVGDPFAPRNPYCLKIDTLKEPPMFKITDTHYAKTWLLHPSAPQIEKPDGIKNIHEKLINAFNI